MSMQSQPQRNVHYIGACTLSAPCDTVSWRQKCSCAPFFSPDSNEPINFYIFQRMCLVTRSGIASTPLENVSKIKLINYKCDFASEIALADCYRRDRVGTGIKWMKSLVTKMPSSSQEILLGILWRIHKKRAHKNQIGDLSIVISRWMYDICDSCASICA